MNGLGRSAYELFLQTEPALIGKLSFHPLTIRVAFKFGHRVHFELRRNMLKPPIAHLPAIYLD